MTLAPIRGFGTSTNWIGFEDLEQQYQTLSTRLQQCAGNPHDEPRELLMQCDALLKNMALRATRNPDKREQLELNHLQLNTFKQHFNYEEQPKKKKTMTTFNFQNAPREVADENYNGGVQPEGFGSTTLEGSNGKLANISDQLQQVNPLKQFSENESFTTFNVLGEGADIYASGIVKDNISQKKTEKVLEVEKVLVVETVEDLDIWD
eukprot:CAMPEP_0119027654 /NCGR_PEP_ID=MMETSP1176-20130426/37475_1 /TAXON_ID=265551 /ORGANISM="Synedropsis recta cf, Strain CCMP1620" /LENGTH=206 /DNA_ID=CAMNT_0006983615 /DNA_START=73 /DNA_END=693 /DNA_ORIENTATION=+